MNVTQVQPAARQPAASAPSSELNGASFITLLSAQLKAQDPTSPMDPTQFVTQLVQFNMLQQTIEIHQLLQRALEPAVSGDSQSGQSLKTTGGM